MNCKFDFEHVKFEVPIDIRMHTLNRHLDI